MVLRTTFTLRAVSPPDQFHSTGSTLAVRRQFSLSHCNYLCDRVAAKLYHVSVKAERVHISVANTSNVKTGIVLHSCTKLQIAKPSLTPVFSLVINAFVLVRMHTCTYTSTSTHYNGSNIVTDDKNRRFICAQMVDFRRPWSHMVIFTKLVASYLLLFWY